MYTPSEVRTLTPVRENVEKRSAVPDLRDVFLCHAWDDRNGAAKELHDLLETRGVSVWFSEKDVLLGSSLLREIDKGLAKSRVGIVLVTPALLRRLKGEGIADKELSALLARDLLVPIVHNTTYEDLRDVSPLLGSRSGLSTAEEPMADVAAKLAELVTATTNDIIVIGDLNATPWSSALDPLFDAGLVDTRLGYAATWPTGMWPLRIPIDLCLVSANFGNASFHVGPDVGSDHLPVFVALSARN